MAFNRCHFSVSGSPGTTGDIVVGSAIDSTWAVPASTDDGFKATLTIYESGLGFEVRTGCTYTHSGTTWSRGTLEQSSSGSAVNFTSSAKAFVTVGAAESGRLLQATGAIWQNNTKGYGDIHVISSTASLTLTADRAYAVPFLRAVDASIDAVAFRVSTAGASGKLAKVAVYDVGSDGLPGTKLAESGSLAVDSTGNKIGTFTAFKPPARFFCALVCDGAPIIIATASGTVGWCPLGLDGTLNPTPFIYHAGATSITFPGTWTAVASASNTSRPWLIARLA